MKKIFVVTVLFTALIISCGDQTEIVSLESGLRYLDDSLGTGKEVKPNDLVTIHFEGWKISDTTNLFGNWSGDQQRSVNVIGNSRMRNQPVKFVLGTNSFIKGSDGGIVGMNVGGRRTIIIPSELAYGKQGIGPIPPDTDLKIVVDLIDARDRVIVEPWEVDSISFITSSNGLKYAVVKEGEGAFADSGNVVTVHYSGYLGDETIFDSSVERDEPFSFMLGMGQVIPGWDEGIKLMKKGSKVRFIIPPNLAYGEMQLEKIPANSTLIFDIELLDIQ
ncbi:MAG: FKBP-type peptidyl-prolyl cis-trans isomerase [Ignavibacteriaceae bacterium]|nr:FKBP-type peptidyl-prolyl cis-trans isomerase [Ignavibacteriaceae bacterium]